MLRQPEPSIVGQRIFRELDGPECATVFAQDLIDRLERIVHDPLFRERVEQMYIKTGRFGTGACFPVVKVGGALTFKVYTSLEAYRSQEKMPPPFDVVMDIQAGEEGPEPLPVVSGTMRVNREVGVSTETAVDQVRLDVGLEVLAPMRDEAGYIKNKPVPESESNPKSRKAAAKEAGETEPGEPEVEKFECAACGAEAKSKAGLISHQRFCKALNKSQQNGDSDDSETNPQEAT